MADESNHPLQPKLDQLAGRLETTLEEVCEDISITEAETSELIRIEETLAHAREVAKHAISVQRRIDADGETPALS